MNTFEEAYSELGANYADVLSRLMNEKLVKRFVGKFFEDDSFERLRNALEAKDTKEAFMAAHTLKGVIQNLGFDNMYPATSAITETLRAESLEGTDALFKEIEVQYNRTAEVMKPLL